MANRPWTREEILLAIDLYCKLPYARLNQVSPEIKALANLLGRTPSAISMRCCNYAQFDPVESTRVKGFSHAAKQDRAIWKEVTADWEKFAVEVEGLLKRYHAAHSIKDAAKDIPFDLPAGIDKEQNAHVRTGQCFFRNAVLTAYGHRCCVSGVTRNELLIASHIKPWKDSDPKTERTNPRNGLCLSPLYDRAFDAGLMTADEQGRIVFSAEIKSCASHDITQAFFLRFEGKHLLLPERFMPDQVFFDHHRTHVFQKWDCGKREDPIPCLSL